MSVDQVILSVSESVSSFFVLPYLAIFVFGFLLGTSKGHTLGLSLALTLVLSLYFGIEFLPILFLLGGIYSFGSLMSTKWLGKDIGILNFSLSLSILSLFFMVVPTLERLLEIPSGYFNGPYILVYIVVFILVGASILRLNTLEWKTISIRYNEYKNIVDRDSNAITYILLYILSCYLNYTLVPVLNYDDLANHYYIQNQFALGTFPSFDVSKNVWAVSQWLFDLYYGFMNYLFSGKGRTFVNGLMLLGILFLSFKILKKKFSTNVSLLLTLVGISSPLVVLALTTSQTELVTLFLAITITYLWIEWKKVYVFASIPIFAFAVAIKPSNAVIFILPFLMFTVRYCKQNGLKEFFVSKNLLLVIFSVFIAFYPYAFAYYIAGNPVFPLFNSLFSAPFFPASDFFNSTYTGNFGFAAFWGLLFETSRFLESSDGVVGVQLALLPFFLVAIIFSVRRTFYLTVFVWCIFISGLMLFYSQQYARYIMPSLYLIPLLSVLCLRGKFFNLLIKVISIIVIFVNIVLSPGVIWYLNKWNNTFGLSSKYQIKYLDNRESIERVNDYLNSLPGKVNPLYPYNKPYAANIKGSFTYLNWYNQYNQEKYLSGKAEIRKLIREKKITHVIINSNSSKDIVDMAKKMGVLVYQDVNYDVYEIGAPSLNLTVSNEIVVGKPSKIDKNSFNVDKDNFYILEYDIDYQVRYVEITLQLECSKGSLWKNYIEYDRYTNFTNHLTLYKCNSSREEHTIKYTLIPPRGTKHMRLFLQPMVGQFTVELKKTIMR